MAHHGHEHARCGRIGGGFDGRSFVDLAQPNNHATIGLKTSIEIACLRQLVSVITDPVPQCIDHQVLFPGSLQARTQQLASVQQLAFVIKGICCSLCCRHATPSSAKATDVSFRHSTAVHIPQTGHLVCKSAFCLFQQPKATFVVALTEHSSLLPLDK